MSAGVTMGESVDDRLFLRLLAIVRAVSVEASASSLFTAGDFCHRWHSETDPDTPPSVRIWQSEDGSDRGFVWLSDAQLHLVVRPGIEAPEDEMLDWGERERGKGAAASAVRVLAGAEGLQRLLSSRGYRPGSLTLILRSRRLTNLPASRPLMPGYNLSDAAGVTMPEEWAVVYRQSFAPESMSSETVRRVTGCPLYRPELDLVCTTRDGRVAAFALVWFDPMTKSGTFEPVGCDPCHQRKGLSRALMHEGLMRLQALGAEQAWVTTSISREPANRLYESLGFQEHRRSLEWIASA